MKRRRIIFTIILVVTISCLLVSLILLASYRAVYFRDFDNADAVENYVLSTVSLGETTITDIYQLVDSRAYGKVDCKLAPANEDIYTCYASTGQLWQYYAIQFIFEDKLLVDVTVNDAFIGL